MKFGDPSHPFKPTTESARKAAQANVGKTRWRQGMSPLSKRGMSPEFVPGVRKADARLLKELK